MDWRLIVGILIISTTPLFAQGAQPDLAKLKPEAKSVVSIIKGDKGKTDVYCEINDLREQIGEAEQDKDSKKAEGNAARRLLSRLTGASRRGQFAEQREMAWFLLRRVTRARDQRKKRPLGPYPDSWA
jgi:hypothetical protein